VQWFQYVSTGAGEATVMSDSVKSISSDASENKVNASSRGNLWRYFFYYFYFSGLHQIIIYASGIAGISGLLQAILMSFLWIIPILLFPSQSKFISGVTGLFLWASSLVTMGYLALYHQDFSQSVLFIIFESNWSESSEFLESYFSWWMIPALMLYTAVPFLIWRHLRPIYFPIRTRMILIVSISLIVSWPAFDRLVIKQTSLQNAITHQINSMEPVAPWHLILGYIKYKKSLHEIEQYLLANKNMAPLRDLYDKNSNTSNTLVLVIGESTNRLRMNIYGYYRDTTPQLTALKNELLVFDNVYAPRPYTIETLEQVLSFADEKTPDLYLKKPTLINLMQQAGYKTYWITNQQTQTERNTMLTTFSKQADEQIYLNNNRSQNSSQYDEIVIKPFEKILNSTEQKKFIVIHLLGTHRAYHYRYPDGYNYFNTNRGLPFWIRSRRHAREYNEYDNAVRYNDYVVSLLIQKLKESKNNGFLAYFSDHGEEVYDNPGHLFAGRNEAAPSRPMYAVPFIIWRSDSWRKRNKLADTDTMLHRAYSLSDFIHTWSDLAGISYEEFDSSRSIINPSYLQHPVWIGDPKTPEKLRDLQKQPFSEPRRMGYTLSRENNSSISMLKYL
jgi:heptose-I-phosphate ethanolaminephosphotransferase